jgi:hypothetical protein
VMKCNFLLFLKFHHNFIDHLYIYIAFSSQTMVCPLHKYAGRNKLRSQDFGWLPIPLRCSFYYHLVAIFCPCGRKPKY